MCIVVSRQRAGKPILHRWVILFTTQTVGHLHPRPIRFPVGQFPLTRASSVNRASPQRDILSTATISTIPRLSREVAQVDTRMLVAKPRRVASNILALRLACFGVGVVKHLNRTQTNRCNLAAAAPRKVVLQVVGEFVAQVAVLIDVEGFTRPHALAGCTIGTTLTRMLGVVVHIKPAQLLPCILL